MGGAPAVSLSFDRGLEWMQAGKPVELIVAEGFNHFEIRETFANPFGIVGRALLAQMKLSINGN